MPDRPRYDAYIRVSRVAGRSGESFHSPVQQRDTIMAWAAMRGVEIAQTHTDLDVSGGRLDRPGLDALMARVRSREIDGVAVARLDRLSRAGVADALKLVEEIAAHGGAVAAVDLGIDPMTAFGEFGMTIMLALARMEHRRLSESWETAKARAIDRGAKISPTPIGYQREPDGTLSEHPQLGVVITQAFRAAAARGLHAAVDHLQANAPGHAWTTSSVRRLLANRAYLGESRHGDLVRLDAHPALASRAVWEAAQHGHVSRRAAAAFPLSGLARCARCGGPMVGGRAGHDQRTYRCAATLTKHRGDRCVRGAHILADALEGHVREQARTDLASAALVIGDTEGDTLALAERAVVEAEAELEAFASDLTLRRALAERYHDHLASRVHALERARAAYREHAKRSEATVAMGAPELLDGTPEEFGLLLRSIFAAIVVEPGRGRVAERVRLVPLHAKSPSGVPRPADPQ